VFNAASTGSEGVTVLLDGKTLVGATVGSSYGTYRTAPFDTGAAPGPHKLTFIGNGKTGTIFITNIVAETVNGMYNSALQDISSTSQSEAAWAKAFGLQVAGYEGSFTFGTGANGTALQNIANLDPRAQQASITQMNEFYASGGDLAMYYDTTN